MTRDTLINQETGEVYEISKTDEQNNALVAELFTDKILDLYAQYEALKEQKEMFEYRLRKVCEEKGIKSVNGEYFTISYIPAHKATRVDTDKLKRAGLYDEFSKESEVKESVRVKIK